MRCENAHEDGAYVLGALTPAERANYERHLAGCTGCRDAVADLAVLPGLLARLDQSTAERITREADAVEASRLPRLLRAAEDSRQRIRARRRWQAWGAGLAAASVTLVVGLGITALQDEPVAPPAVVMEAMERPPWSTAPVAAEIGLTEVAGGTRIRLHCTYGWSSDHHGVYPFKLVAYGIGGYPEQVGSWEAGPGADLVMESMTRLSISELDRLELQSMRTGAVFLTYTVR